MCQEREFGVPDQKAGSAAARESQSSSMSVSRTPFLCPLAGPAAVADSFAGLRSALLSAMAAPRLFGLAPFADSVARYQRGEACREARLVTASTVMDRSRRVRPRSRIHQGTA
jgi:hypothetical protein